MSVMGTNVKINIFETLLVTSANVNKKNVAKNFLNMTRYTNFNMYLFSKIKTVVGSGFLMKSHTIFITMHGFAFSYISRIQVHVFVTNTAFVANPVWE